MSVLSLLAATYDGGYSFNESSNSTDPGTAMATFVVIAVIALIFYLIIGFLLYKIFQKAGRPGWAGFVPVYNGWVLFEISGKPGWWILFGFIPWLGGLVLFVLTLLASLELAKRFGRSQLFGVLALWLFSIVGYAILAFDSSKYQAVPAAGVQPSAPSPGQDNSTGPTSPTGVQ